MRQAPRPPHFFIDHFRHVESIKAPKYTGAGIPPTDDQLLIMILISIILVYVYVYTVQMCTLNE